MILIAPKIAAYSIINAVTYPFNISYFTLTKRNASRSYYSLSAPYSNGLANNLLTYINSGLIYITKNGATLEYFNIDDFDIDVGSNSSSIRISGYRQETISSPTTYIVDPKYVVYKNTTSKGNISLGLIPFVYDIRAGDSINYGGVTKLVDYYNLTVSLNLYEQTFNLI